MNTNPNASNIVKKTEEFRGKTIELMVEIERNMDSFLINYFVSDPIKREQFYNLMLDSSKSTLKSKYLSYKEILEGGFDSLPHKKTYFAALDKAIEIRNMMAHCRPDVSEEAILINKNNKDHVFFLKYMRDDNKGKKDNYSIPFSNQIFKELEDSLTWLIIESYHISTLVE